MCDKSLPHDPAGVYFSEWALQNTSIWVHLFIEKDKKRYASQMVCFCANAINALSF